MRRVLLVALLMGSVLGVRSSAVSGRPAGRFRLATVDGVRVPMVWHAVDLHEGGQLLLSWQSGTAHVRTDGTFAITLVRAISGPAVPGSPVTDSLTGLWRWTAGNRVELRFADGRRTSWEGLDGFRSLTIRVAHADLDGERRTATMVLVHD